MVTMRSNLRLAFKICFVLCWLLADVCWLMLSHPTTGILAFILFAIRFVGRKSQEYSQLQKMFLSNKIHKQKTNQKTHVSSIPNVFVLADELFFWMDFWGKHFLRSFFCHQKALPNYCPRLRHLDDPSFRWPSQPRRCLVPWLEFVDNFRGPCHWYHFERLKVGFCCVFFRHVGRKMIFLSWTDLNVCWFLLIGLIWIDVVIHGWLMFVGRIYLDELLDIIEVMKRSNSHRSHRIHGTGTWILHLPFKKNNQM